MVRPALKHLLRRTSRSLLQLHENIPRQISTDQQNGCILDKSARLYSRNKQGICGVTGISRSSNYSTTSTGKQGVIFVDGGETIVRSPYPDIDIDATPFGAYIMSKLDVFKDFTILVDYPSGRTFTGAQLKDHITRVASALYKQGYRKGDTVLMISSNSAEVVLLSVAAAVIGVIISPANPAYVSVELARQLSHSGAKAVFTSMSNLAVVKEALSSHKELQDRIKTIFTLDGTADGCQPFQTLLEDDGKGFPENIDLNNESDIVLLPYSSGTTGLPKGVMLTGRNLLVNLLQTENGQVRFVPGESVLLGLLPFFHIYGYFVFMMSIAQGCKLVIHPGFEAENFLTSIQKYKITHANIVPPIALFLAKHPVIDKFDLTSLNKIVTAAAPLGGSISKVIEDRLNVKVLQAYGLTETSPVLTHDEFPHKHGTVGTLLPNTLAKVIDPVSGKILSVGETGEFVFKGPQVMKGYFNNPDATANTIQNGWFHSGDIGMVDSEGYFTISDRLKELIKYKGYQVAPAELEAVLCTHPGIQDAAVIGVKAGEDIGEIPKAFVVLKPDVKISDEDVMEFVKTNVAHFKRLRGGVEFINEIPKNASGKILRRILKS